MVLIKDVHREKSVSNITINANPNRAIVVGDLFHDSNAYGWNVEGLRYTTCAAGGLSYCLNIKRRVRKYSSWFHIDKKPNII